ncbi:MAG: vWA domain-containing protein [Planctomycetaceae bacterium]
MPRTDLTDITFVLDRSGSMGFIKAATIEAFNGFLSSQCSGDGIAELSLVQFDDQYEPMYAGRNVNKAPKLTDRTYQPRGSTALLDAMGRTIVATGQRLSRLREHKRPGTVIFVTLTDGFENASREFTLHRINEMIREQREKYSWQFIFLGANQDAIATAAQMGVGADQAMTFAASTTGTMGCFQALGGKLNRVRKARGQGIMDEVMAFDSADRAAAAGRDDQQTPDSEPRESEH